MASLWLLMSAWSLTLVGCSFADGGIVSMSQTPTETVVTSLETPLESILRLAMEHDASPEQIEILKVVATSGVVTFAQLRLAVDATYQCLDDAGIEYIEDHIEPGAQLPLITYRIGVPTAESDRVSDACVYRHSFFVESAYLNQPSALDAKEAAFTKARAHFIECLSAAGYSVDDMATNDEIKDLIVVAMTGSSIGSAEEPPPGFVPVFCLEGTGINGF